MEGASPIRVLSVDPGSRNLGIWLGEHVRALLFRFLFWSLIDLQTNDPMKATESLLQRLTPLFERLLEAGVTHVVIEAQSISSQNIKRIYTALYVFFRMFQLIRGGRFILITRGGPGKLGVYQGPIDPIRFKKIKALPVEGSGRLKSEAKHTLNKETGIAHCTLLLESSLVELPENKRYYDFMQSLDKKDDVCDSALQGMAEILRIQKERNKPLSKKRKRTNGI